jgi:hypothetical protein
MSPVTQYLSDLKECVLPFLHEDQGAVTGYEGAADRRLTIPGPPPFLQLRKPAK